MSPSKESSCAAPSSSFTISPSASYVGSAIHVMTSNSNLLSPSSSYVGIPPATAASAPVVKFNPQVQSYSPPPSPAPVSPPAQNLLSAAWDAVRSGSPRPSPASSYVAPYVGGSAAAPVGEVVYTPRRMLSRSSLGQQVSTSSCGGASFVGAAGMQIQRQASPRIQRTGAISPRGSYSAASLASSAVPASGTVRAYSGSVLQQQPLLSQSPSASSVNFRPSVSSSFNSSSSVGNPQLLAGLTPSQQALFHQQQEQLAQMQKQLQELQEQMQHSRDPYASASSMQQSGLRSGVSAQAPASFVKECTFSQANPIMRADKTGYEAQREQSMIRYATPRSAQTSPNFPQGYSPSLPPPPPLPPLGHLLPAGTDQRPSARGNQQQPPGFQQHREQAPNQRAAHSNTQQAAKGTWENNITSAALEIARKASMQAPLPGGPVALQPVRKDYAFDPQASGPIIGI
eukprot:TRINITY_DN52004_c0_g1_i1.p1 TRINITY_DN52004_c0_g1~~TRINITY_DN52004_c0_g1_i1.p1  ORF type:complete len:502 (-),score=69.41 TRINITY_DN52004_c0_g1_i1:81-1451(-)